jgi:hypothetical protein
MTRFLNAPMTIAHWIYGLRAAAGSVRDYLNPVELVRVVLPALLHGGGTYAVLTALLDSASAVFAPAYVGAAVAVLTALVQIARLLDHDAAA